MRGFFALLALMIGGLAVAGRAAETAAEMLRPEHSDAFFNRKPRIYLDGVWKYRLVDARDDYRLDDEGIRDEYFAPAYDDSAWAGQQVPKDVSLRSNEGGRAGAAYYRKTFDLPEKYHGRRVIAYFQGIGFEPVIYVNGTEAARPVTLTANVSSRARVDITEHLRFGGTNTLCVRLFQYLREEHAGRAPHIGLYGPVWLEIADPVYASKMLITPRLPDGIEVRAEIVNTLDVVQKLDLKAIAEPWQADTGRPAASHALGARELQPGTNSLVFEMRIADPVLWDMFNPFLYSLKILGGDYTIGWERFGLRHIETRAGHFYLNGKRIFLNGITLNEGNIGRFFETERYNDLFWYNHNGFLRKYLTLLRKHNCLVVHRHAFSTPDIFSDICDEVGLLQVPSYEILNETRFSNHVKRMLAKPGSDISGKWVTVPYKPDGKINVDIINPDGYKQLVKEAFTRNIEADYNHPSIIAFGPEGEANRVPGITHMFPWYKQVLREIDPIRLFSSAQTFCHSGRRLDGEWAPLDPPPPFDYQNSAGVNAGGTAMNVVPFTLTPFTARWCHWNWVNQYYTNPIPVIATEALFYGVSRYTTVPRLWAWHTNTYAPLVRGGLVDLEQYAALMSLSDLKQDAARIGCWPSRSFIKVAGMKYALDRARIFTAVGERVKQYIELARVSDDYLQGFGSVSGEMFDYRPLTGLRDLDPDAIHADHPIGLAFQQACAPVFICAPVYAGQHNLLAGGAFKTDIYCFNGTLSDLDRLEVAVEIGGPAGPPLLRDVFPVASITAGAKRQTNYACVIPGDAATGDYGLKLTLLQDGRPVSENRHPLYILGRADYARQVAPPAPAALILIPRGEDAGQNGMLEQKLKRMGIQLDFLADIADLNRYQYLVIGPFAVGEHNAGALKQIADWVRNGGCLLCFEQSYAGPVPWLPELAWQPLAARFSVPTPRFGIDAAPVREDHPVLAGLSEKKYWSTWNSPSGQVYSGLLMPLDRDVIVAAPTLGDKGCSTPLLYGMAVAEKTIGQGRILFSQLDTTMAITHEDAIAHKYLNNLVAYFFKLR